MADIDTWMPWHIAEYLADTMHLSTLEHGAYLLLLAHGWRNDGMIADSDRNLAGVTRLPLDQWKAIRPTIERFFVTVNHPVYGLCWNQKRQVEEIKKAKEQKAKSAEKVRRMTAARWPIDRQPLDSPCRTPQGYPEDILKDSPLRGKGKGSSDLPPEGIAYRPQPRSEEAMAAEARVNPPRPPSAKEEFWAALCHIFDLKPATVSDEQRLYQQCLDFRLKGATVPEIEKRAQIYRLRFPQAAFTPKAVLNNWDIIKEAPPPPPQTFNGRPEPKKSKALA